MTARSAPNLTVHVPSTLDPEALSQRTDSSIQLISLDREPGQIGSIQVLIDGRPTRERIEACSNLRMLIIPYAGLPSTTRELMLNYPHIAVHNLHHNAAAAAELAMALFLAAAKRIIPADRALRVGDWSIRYADAGDVQLEGKRALILGFGSIGRRIARACAGLGMEPIGIRRSAGPRFHEGTGAQVHQVGALGRLLPGAHALFVALPLTHDTTGMIGAEALGLLPPRAVLVNVARGAIVEENALYDALRGGKIGGAGLDVWYRYPREENETSSTYPSSFPFHELDNVVLSPHRGGAFNRPELERLRLEHLARLLNAATRGEAVPNRVDLHAGY